VLQKLAICDGLPTCKMLIQFPIMTNSNISNDNVNANQL